MKTLFDTEVKKLCHSGDPETSREAAKKIVESGKLNDQEEWVLSHIAFYCRSNNTDEFTAKEIVSFCHSTRNFYFIIQRRLSGLHRKGKIERTGQKRNGCAVWKLK